MTSWPTVSLGEILGELEAGVSVNGATEPVASEGEVGVLKVSCVSGGRFLSKENKCVIDGDVSRVAVSPCNGDIIISRANTLELVGASGYVEGNHPNLFLSDKLWRATLDGGKDDPQWTIALLNSSQVRKELRRRATGTSGSMKNISKSAFRRLEVPRPSTAQQAQLGSMFASIECVLRQSSRLADEFTDFKHGLAQQLLTGKKRFPAFRQREWATAVLGKHVKSVKRKNGHGCKLVLTASGAHGLVDQREYFNRKVSAADLSGYYALKRGEFAYNRSAMNGYPYGAIKRLDTYNEGVLSTLYSCFAIDDANLDSNFLQHVFDSGLLNRQLRRIVKVGARAHGLLNVADADFYAVRIPFPALDEQKAIAAVLDGMDHEIDLLKDQRQQYDLYKRGLMQRLLSGEIQVPA